MEPLDDRSFSRYMAERLSRMERTLVKHSMFAYPHFWFWHVMFDGTRLCRCWHSREMKRGFQADDDAR